MIENTVLHGEKNNVRYAGFWVRVAALIIDGIIRFIIVVTVALPLTTLFLPFSSDVILSYSTITTLLVIIWVIIILTVYLGYDVYFITRPNGATPGKQAMGLRVVDEKYNYPISLGKALLRETIIKIFLGRLTFGILTLISVLLVITDSKKQAVHDRLAKTYVVHNTLSDN